MDGIRHSLLGEFHVFKPRTKAVVNFEHRAAGLTPTQLEAVCKFLLDFFSGTDHSMIICTFGHYIFASEKEIFELNTLFNNYANFSLTYKSYKYKYSYCRETALLLCPLLQFLHVVLARLDSNSNLFKSVPGKIV